MRTDYLTLPSAARELVQLHEREAQAAYRAYLFGQFRIYRGGRQLVDESPRRTKALLILKWFLLNPGKPCSADEFIELFWPDSPPQRALTNFHVTMHRLRRILESDLTARQESTFIRRSPHNFYRFERSDRWWTDVGDAESLFDQAQASDAVDLRHRARFYYRRVAGYCARGLLPEDDTTEELLLPHRRRFREMHSQALTRLMQLSAESGEPEELLEYAYQMLDIDRYNEAATRIVVDALLQLDQPAQAHRRLQVFWEGVQRELGVCPTGELRELRARVRSALSRGVRPGESALSRAVTPA
ncbi:BTAD domain-containing putative transcriptional regulator [Micromonospora sp. WMMA1998]|uniref:AfsR/SARP family transcriptional regulator n=1 Tax=Micromonospora sp. WMMA1998 TaxID=3015167 RepID=UPI00248C702F|nr:BTAD domain-containing putative transcriptional regulator [Micromonospora sp. WMMA1998]WBC14949.1 BTAD domain-containing putative transcriptional regulator [Micromonospora sp. WMMA1998]